MVIIAALCAGCGGNDSGLSGTWSGTQQGSASPVYTFTFTDQITSTITASVNPLYVGKTSNAIYLISGTKLSFAGNEPGNAARPTAFATAGNTVAFDLTRQ